MKSRKIHVALALSACATVAIAGNSIARDRAAVEVTIKGGGEVHGQVKSDKNKCKREVTVKLVKKQSGADIIVTTDTTEEVNGKWKWNAGNPGDGRYYAKLSAQAGCDPDKSPTVTVP